MTSTIIKITCFFAVAIFFSTVHTSTVSAQTQGQYIRKGDEKFEAGDYGSALVYYDTVYQMRNSELDLGYKIAEAARLYKAFLAAAPAYKHVYSHKKGPSKYPLASFWLADVERALGNYDSAVYYYERFLETNPEVEPYYRERALENIENSEYAMEQLRSSFQKLEVEHLDGAEVNTARKELAPYWDGDKLYFSSLRFRDSEEDIRAKPYAQILLFKDSITGVADSISIKRKFTSHTAFNKDHTRAYFTICSYVDNRYEIKCQIYYRKKNEEGKWGLPTRMTNEVNTPDYTTTQPAVTYDKETGEEILYFTSNRPGGKGKLDVWYTTLNEEGNAAATATNMSQINTREDDMTPYYDDYFDILYFSSEGHQNMGGFDIFELKRKDGSWGEVKNLGPAINTSYDETHMTVDHTGNLAHFASNHLDKVVHDTAGRIEWRTCCSDLFRVELGKFIRFKPIAYCDENLKAVTWTVKSTKKPGFEPLIVPSKKDPKKSWYLLELDDEFTFVAEKEGYFTDSFTISTVDALGGSYDSTRLRIFPVITLSVAIFNKLNREPVNEAVLTLLGADGQEYSGTKEDNTYVYLLRPGGTYNLKIGGENVAPRERKIDLPTGCDPQTIEFDIPVLPEKLRLPIFLYFDNDHPNPSTLQTTTTRTYEQTYERYYGLQDEFVAKMIEPYVNDSTSTTRDSVEADVRNFFENKMKKGYLQLEGFADELIKYLEAMEEDQKLTISIRGFASPLASGEYNKRLTSRRISAVRNYFNQYYGDRLERFITNEKLVIKEVPFGESEAEPGIGDTRNDVRSSIYSVRASKERRVEIIDIAAD